MASPGPMLSRTKAGIAGMLAGVLPRSGSSLRPTIIERMEVDLVFSRLHGKHDLLILDVGAHHGEFLDIFERHPDEHRYRVVCVEPLPDNSTELRRRLASYARVSATVCELAISDEPGLRTFYLGDESTLFTCTPDWLERFPEHFASPRAIEIECVTVAGLLGRVGLAAATRFDLLKVDTEGHDLHVLKAFVASDASADAIIFEVGGRVEDVAAGVDVLRAAGYREFYLFGRNGIPTTYVGEYAGLDQLRSLFARGLVTAGNVVAFS